MQKTLKVLGIAGSLREKSFNKALLRASQSLAPKTLQIEIFDLAPIPLYNRDIETIGFPASVIQFRQQIAEADALLIGSPEYNFSITGVLKNAIDWASRPPEQPFSQKPIAIMGGGGTYGSARSQYDLRKILGGLNAYVLPKPELMITKIATKFDENGQLIDEETQKYLTRLLEAFQEWTLKFN